MQRAPEAMLPQTPPALKDTNAEESRPLPHPSDVDLNWAIVLHHRQNPLRAVSAAGECVAVFRGSRKRRVCFGESGSANTVGWGRS